MFPMFQLNVNLNCYLSVINLSSFWMVSVDIPENCRLYSQESFNSISTKFNGFIISRFNIRSLTKLVGNSHHILTDWIRTQMLSSSVKLGLIKQTMVILQDIKHSIPYGRKKRAVDFEFFVGIIYLLKH